MGARLDVAISIIAPSIDFMVDGFSIFATADAGHHQGGRQ